MPTYNPFPQPYNTNLINGQITNPLFAPIQQPAKPVSGIFTQPNPTGTIPSGLRGVAPTPTYGSIQPTQPTLSGVQGQYALAPKTTGSFNTRPTQPVVGVLTDVKIAAKNAAADANNTSYYGVQSGNKTADNITLPSNYSTSGYTPQEQAFIDARDAENLRLANATPLTQEQAFTQNLTNYQSQIDSINKLYGDILNQTRARSAISGNRRLGSSSALAINQGLGGSNVGEGMIRQTEDLNQQEAQAAEAVVINEQAQKIANIMGQVRKDSSDQLQKEKDARTKGGDDYVLSIKSKVEQRKSIITNFAKKLLAQGIDINKLSSAEISQLSKDSNLTKDDITNIYNEQKSASDKLKLDAEKDAADLEKKKADTLKTIAETGQVGKITPGEAARLGISQQELSLAKEKFAFEKTKESPLSKEQINQTIRKQMATSEWQTRPKGTSKDDFKQQQKNYILTLGGDPSDYGL